MLQRLTPALAIVSLLLAAPAFGANQEGATVDSDSVNITINDDGLGAGVQRPLYVDAKGPGPADDELVFLQAVAGGSCPRDPITGLARCPLGSGTSVIRQVQMTVN